MDSDRERTAASSSGREVSGEGPMISRPDSPAASAHDVDEWNITYEHVDPNDPLIAWHRWREALRELTKPKYGVATMTVAHKALGDE